MNITSIIGRVAADPEEEEYDGKDFVTFAVYVTKSYDDRETGEKGQSIIFNVAVWNPELMEHTLDEIRKGMEVGVEGPLKVNKGDKKTFYNLTAHRILLTKSIKPKAEKSERRSTRKSRPKPETRRAPDRGEDEDLDW